MTTWAPIRYCPITKIFFCEDCRVRGTESGKINHSSVCKSAPKKEYFILALKHSTDAVLTWWGPQCQGYSWSLDHAGRYSAEEAIDICKHETNYPVEVEFALSLSNRYIERCKLKDIKTKGILT